MNDSARIFTQMAVKPHVDPLFLSQVRAAIKVDDNWDRQMQMREIIKYLGHIYPDSKSVPYDTLAKQVSNALKALGAKYNHYLRVWQGVGVRNRKEGL